MSEICSLILVEQDAIRREVLFALILARISAIKESANPAISKDHLLPVNVANLKEW